MSMQWDTIHEPFELEVWQLLFQTYNMMLYPTLKTAQYKIKNKQKATEKYQLRVQYVFSLRLGQLQPKDFLFYSVKCWRAQNFPGANVGFCQCLEMALEGKTYWKFLTTTGSAMNTDHLCVTGRRYDGFQDTTTKAFVTKQKVLSIYYCVHEHVAEEAEMTFQLRVHMPA